MSDHTNAHDLLQGDPFGRVSPPRDAIDLPAVDGRTVALRILARYISELTFNLPGTKGSGITKKIRIPEEDIHIEWPDNQVQLKAPSIVFVPGNGEHLPAGLATFLVEGSHDKFGKGTALQVQSEYQETFTIEVWANDKPTRRAICGGLEVSLVPVEQMYGIRFRMPDYYDNTVCFTLLGGMRPDDPDAVRNRRWGHLSVEMRFDVLRLVNVVPFDPSVETEAYEPDEVPDGVEIDVEAAKPTV